MVYHTGITYDAGPAERRSIVHQVAGNLWRNKSMMKKILICAIIALVLVPASVMAAGFGGKGTGAASGQGQCLQDGQNCVNQTCQQGTGTQAQYRFGGLQNGANGTKGAQCSGNGQCDTVKNQTRSMLRLHDGSCGGCKTTT
jgi:hypothetical protein